MRQTLLLLSIFTLIVFTSALAVVPQNFSYQGYITDPQGDPLEGQQLIKFNIYADDSGDSLLWSSDFQVIDILQGYFDIILGADPMDPLPGNLFSDNPACHLGITVSTDQEHDLIPLVSVPYTFKSQNADMAERVARGRDLYHNIMDVNPNSVTSVYFIAHNDNPDVTLYLYGDEFQGALPEHTHTGNNAHAHNITGTVESSSVSHTHSYSGTSASSSASHSHSASSGNYNLSHSHTGSSNSVSVSHGHTASTTSGGEHHHDFVFYGIQSGLFLFHYPHGDHQLAAHGTPNQIATASVEHNQSSHGHTLNVNSGGGSHSHSISVGSWGGNHSHSVTVNSASASHSHSYSGTTGAHSVNHSHSFTGSASSTGSGLSAEGISSAGLPSDVSIYIDEILAYGPFTGDFTTGALDLSSYVSTAGEYTIELREEGGTGGRLTYNLFVE
ncbi:MAG: hypothetical protein GY839_11895 [candidate division Zixibacteria bacterium]|nr:hypothetical protein [candidate division Zixibacteria bacterium]